MGREQPQPPQADGGRRPRSPSPAASTSAAPTPTVRCFRSKHKRPTEVADDKKVGWRDTHVQIEGPAVARDAMQYSFIDLWVQPGCAANYPSSRLLSEAGRRPGDKLIRVLAGRSGCGDSDIYKAMVLAINGAQKVDPHHGRLFRAGPADRSTPWSAAAKRGIDVKPGAAGRVGPWSDVRYAGQAILTSELLASRRARSFGAAGGGAARQDGGGRRRLVDDRLGQHRPAAASCTTTN